MLAAQVYECVQLRSGSGCRHRIVENDREGLEVALAWPQHSNVDTLRRAEYHATGAKAACQSLGSGPEVNRCVASSTACRI